MSSIVDRVDIGTGPISPERRLFVSVIAAAVMDATGSVRGGDHEGNAALSKASARAWFADAGADFQTVCTLAGFEPGAVRHRVLAYLDRAKVNPAEIVRMPSARIGRPRRSIPTDAVTMKDVARHAGVSLTTVNNAYYCHKRIASETRARVLKSADAIGYVRPRRRAASVH